MFWIRVAGVVGFLAVAFGAFGAHALKKKKTAEELEAYKTGVLYHLVHAPVLLQLGLFQQRTSSEHVDTVGALFLTGIVLFSGSLYLLTLTGRRKLGAITPLGGLALVAGWVAVAVMSASGS